MNNYELSKAVRPLRDHAIKTCDAFFTGFNGDPDSPEHLARKKAYARARAEVMIFCLENDMKIRGLDYHPGEWILDKGLVIILDPVSKLTKPFSDMEIQDAYQ